MGLTMNMENNKVDIKELLETMTLDEKMGQLLQISPCFFKEDLTGEITGPMEDLGIDEKDIRNAGSVLGIGELKKL